MNSLSKEDALFKRKIVELKERCQLKGITTLTSFLSLEKQKMVEEICGNKVILVKNGYFDNAERVRFILKPLDSVYDEIDDFQIDMIIAHYNSKFIRISHRDVLGAILALGIDRELIGDIVINDDSIAIALHKNISEYVINELKQIHKLNVNFVVSDKVLTKEENFEYHKHIVSNRRLDIIVASITNLSRNKAQMLIKEGIVKLNDKQCLKNDQIVEFNERISIRGFGKYFINELIGTTKKDNIILEIAKYI